MSIRLENIIIGMKVLTRFNSLGTVIDLDVNENNRVYATIRLDENDNIIREPIDRISRW